MLPCAYLLAFSYSLERLRAGEYSLVSMSWHTVGTQTMGVAEGRSTDAINVVRAIAGEVACRVSHRVSIA